METIPEEDKELEKHPDFRAGYVAGLEKEIACYVLYTKQFSVEFRKGYFTAREKRK